MEFKKEEDDDVNPVGEVAVSVLFWITVVLAFGSVVHRLLF